MSQLETTPELVERLRAHFNGCSYYRLAKNLQVHENTIRNWKIGKAGIGRELGLRVAELLGEPPEYILACLEAERETDAGVRRIWRRIAEAFRTKAAALAIILIGVAGAGFPAASKAYGDSLFTPDIDYAKRRRPLQRSWWRDLLASLLRFTPRPAPAWGRV